MSFLSQGTLVLFTITFCRCYLLPHFSTEDKLDQFIVTWVPPGSNNSYGFVHMPRTTQEATQRGCILLDNGCNNPDLHYKGCRYFCNNSVDALPIYDTNGYVAGIQMAILKQIADEVTSLDYSNFSSAIEETIMGEQYYVVTVYFIKPDRICSGRSEKEFRSEGTMTSVYIQNGTEPFRDSVMIPPIGDNTTLFKMNWIEGKCVPTMGLHYYHDFSYNMSSTSFYTNFLMYDETSPTRRMAGVGFMMYGNYAQTSHRYEFVPKESLQMFVKQVPKCLYGAWDQAKGITSMHVFFVKDPTKIACINQASGSTNTY